MFQYDIHNDKYSSQGIEKVDCVEPDGVFTIVGRSGVMNGRQYYNKDNRCHYNMLSLYAETPAFQEPYCTDYTDEWYPCSLPCNTVGRVDVERKSKCLGTNLWNKAGCPYGASPELGMGVSQPHIFHCFIQLFHSNTPVHCLGCI